MTFESYVNERMASSTAIGIGNGGINILTDLSEVKVPRLQLIAIDNKKESLISCKADLKIQINKRIISDIGAESNPEIDSFSVMKQVEELIATVLGEDLIFIILFLDEDTEIELASLIAKSAKKNDSLIVSIAIMAFEARKDTQSECLSSPMGKLLQYSDTVIVIHNDYIFPAEGHEAYCSGMAKVTVTHTIKCIMDLINEKGIIGVDFADIK